MGMAGGTDTAMGARGAGAAARRLVGAGMAARPDYGSRGAADVFAGAASLTRQGARGSAP
jgi:hypothetical protein